MRWQYEDEPWNDPNRNQFWSDPSWALNTLYGTGINVNDSSKMRWNPLTNSYKAGYIGPDSQWHWGQAPGFGGGGGAASGSSGAASGGGAGGGASGAGTAGTAGTTGAGAGGIGGTGVSWLDAAQAAGSAYSAYSNSKAQKDAAKAQADLYNNWLKLYQDTGRDLYGQAQASGWNPFGPKVTTTSGSNSSQSGSSFSNKPVITGEYQGIDQLMRNIMTGRLSNPSSLPAGYASNRTRAINQSYEGADQAARNMAASRGLSGEQAYAVASPSNRARAGDIADMRGEIPLLERQMQNEDVQLAANLQRMFGTGQAGTSSNWSTGQNQGQTVSPFNANDLSTLMNVLMPPGPQQSGQTGTSTSGQVVDSLGGLLGFLMSQQGQGGQQPNAAMQGLYNTSPGFMF